MSDNNQDYGGRGCIQLLMLFAFGWGALMMYPKTVDLLTNFAPDEFMGLLDMAGWWGMGSALLIEGVMVVLKLKMWLYPARNLVEWMWDAILSISPFALSAVAQVFDSMLVRGTLEKQPPQIQLLVDYGVPIIPSVIIGLMIVYGLIESAPKGLFGGMQQGGRGIQLPRVKWPTFDLGMFDPRNWFKGKERRRQNTSSMPQMPQPYSPPKSTASNAPKQAQGTEYTLPAFLEASGMNTEQVFSDFLTETETNSMARKVLRDGKSRDGYKMPPNLSNSKFDALAEQVRANGRVINP